jgi:hypothetical protein
MTKGTGIRLIPRMGSHVSHQMLMSRHNLITDGALVNKMSVRRVNFLMPGQVRFLNKFLIALAARVGLVPCMRL